MQRWKFYYNQIESYLPKNSNILVVGASEKEIKIFQDNNYKNVLFSYYDDNVKLIADKYNKNNNFKFQKIDCREINYPDEYFDYTFTHATIHHIDKPHLAILELYRVSKNGVLIIEGNDSLLMRLATYYKYSEKFELSSVDFKEKKGGLLESGDPNFIYRWSEREIIKLLDSYKPSIEKKIIFNYSYDLINKSLDNRYLVKITKMLLKIPVLIFLNLFPKQGNLISIYIDKLNSSKRNFF